MTPEEYAAHVQRVVDNWPPLTAAQLGLLRRTIYATPACRGGDRDRRRVA